jgi:pimeloyl-ACP methyl ester carboxylesterase
VHLIGNSLGARIVLRFAVDYPERVKSLVLDQPIVKNETAGNASLNSRMGSPDLLPEDVKQRRHLQHGDDWQQVVTNYFGIRNTPGLQEHYDLRESCKSVTAPTLITRGDTLEDVTHPLAHAFEFRNSLKNSNLWIKPEGGLFATPEGYDVLRKFVARNSLVTASS